MNDGWIMKRAIPVSVKDLRSNYRQHQKSTLDKNELVGYYLFRPLSFYPTAVFMNHGFTANQTTWISIVALLLGCLLLAVGNYSATIAGALLLNVWVILDFVDGNIARYEQASSRYGELIDTLGAFLAHLAYFAAGIGFYFSSQGSHVSGIFSGSPVVVLILGGVASLSAIWIRLVYQKFRNTFPESHVEKHEVIEVQDTGSFYSIVLHLGHNLVNLSGLLLPLLLAAAVLDGIDVFILLLALANSAILVITLARIVRLAKKQDAS